VCVCVWTRLQMPPLRVCENIKILGGEPDRDISVQAVRRAVGDAAAAVSVILWYIILT